MWSEPAACLNGLENCTTMRDTHETHCSMNVCSTKYTSLFSVILSSQFFANYVQNLNKYIVLIKKVGKLSNEQGSVQTVAHMQQSSNMNWIGINK